jgi:aspartate/methionine/tyrosine aminotransferase
MDKVQDTVPINACQISQRLALHALTSAGPQWVAQMVATLQRNRLVPPLGPASPQKGVSRC